MARFHIKKDGTPGQCTAQPGNCPLGGEGQHYPTMEAAQAASDAKNLESFADSLVNKIPKRPQFQAPDDFNNYLANLNNDQIDNMSESDTESALAHLYNDPETDGNALTALSESGLTSDKMTSMLRDNGVINDKQYLVKMNKNISKYARKHKIDNVGESTRLYETTKFPTNLPEGDDSSEFAVFDSFTNTISPINMGQATHVNYLAINGTPKQRIDEVKSRIYNARNYEWFMRGWA